MSKSMSMVAELGQLRAENKRLKGISTNAPNIPASSAMPHTPMIDAILAGKSSTAPRKPKALIEKEQNEADVYGYFLSLKGGDRMAFYLDASNKAIIDRAFERDPRNQLDVRPDYIKRPEQYTQLEGRNVLC